MGKQFKKGKEKQAIVDREIRKLARKGWVTPKEVVDVARPKNAPLHPFFTWDDALAAERYRQRQARDLIVTVTIDTKIIDGETQTFAILTSDKGPDGSGCYRPTIEILSNAEMREEFLAQALEELRWFRNKYARLKELAADIDKIAKKHTPKKAPKRK